MKKNINIDDLPIKPVNNNSPIPLYHQIEADLRRLMTTGLIAASDVLPPELQLSEAYGVGRHTMREALSRLAADDLITRRAGMGTIVNSSRERLRFYLNRSFSHQMAAMGRTARSKVLDSGVGIFNETHPDIFADYQGEKFFYLQRLRYGDDEPIGLQSTLLVHRFAEGLENENLHDQSLYEVLSSKYNIVITTMNHIVTAEKADELHAESLEIEIGEPVLLIKTSAYVTQNTLIELTSSYYRADRYEYNTTTNFL